MVEKIKGRRLDPNSGMEWVKMIEENINNLETKFNELIDVLRDKNII